MPKRTEATLTDLLNDWAELEPERCEKEPPAHKHLDPVWRIRMGLYTKKGVGVSTVHAGAFIQAAVQEAIEERGWFSDQIQDGGKYYAEVSWTTTYGSAETTMSPARAILAAYLSALRAHA